MTMNATRRQVLAALAAAGTGALTPALRVVAAEAQLEATTVRLAKHPVISLPRNMSATDLCHDERPDHRG